MRFQIDTALLAAASRVGPIISRNSADGKLLKAGAGENPDRF